MEPKQTNLTPQEGEDLIHENVKFRLQNTDKKKVDPAYSAVIRCERG
jgi:hypothetical protein